MPINGEEDIGGQRSRRENANIFGRLCRVVVGKECHQKCSSTQAVLGFLLHQIVFCDPPKFTVMMIFS